MNNQEELKEFKIESLTLQKKRFLKNLFSINYNYILVIEQKNNPSIKIPMIIGRNEAAELAIAIEQLKTSRPLPSEILTTVITELGFSVAQILIDEIKEGIFYSKMLLTNGKETKIIDCRPSESITQSIRFNCGIFVPERLIPKEEK